MLYVVCQLGIDDEIGLIEIGKCVDFIWLLVNLFIVDRLSELEVCGIWVSGCWVDICVWLCFVLLYLIKVGWVVLFGQVLGLIGCYSLILVLLGFMIQVKWLQLKFCGLFFRVIFFFFRCVSMLFMLLIIRLIMKGLLDGVKYFVVFLKFEKIV